MIDLKNILLELMVVSDSVDDCVFLTSLSLDDKFFIMPTGPDS